MLCGLGAGTSVLLVCRFPAVGVEPGVGGGSGWRGTLLGPEESRVPTGRPFCRLVGVGVSSGPPSRELALLVWVSGLVGWLFDVL